MEMNFTMFFLFSVFFVSFLQFADCNTCGSKNLIGNCATLICPPSSSCQKRICTQQNGNSALIGYITAPICVLLLLVTAVLVTIKCVRSRQRRDSLKSDNRSVMNQYSFSRRPPGPPKTMVAFSPFPFNEHEYEDVYMNQGDYDDIVGKDNPIKVTTGAEVTADGYMTPNTLRKPHFPPPPVPDSPN